MHIFPVNDDAGSVLQPAGRRRHVERFVQRVDQLRVRVAFGQLATGEILVLKLKNPEPARP